jgi:hypothetical protein
MNRDKHEYAKGTWIESEEPYDGRRRAKAICFDGKTRIVRLCLAPDTVFSISGRVSRLGSGWIYVKRDEWDGEDYVYFTQREIPTPR